MLVTVAILVLIMAVVAQVFQAATGAVSSAQAIQTLDGSLRRLESVIRSDLGGATAKFTPPLDPNYNLGYFEYGENEFPDIQGEDSDDYIKFTAKAPVGQPFTGRMFLPFPGILPGQVANYLTFQPITITSDYAEIIYFVRNGNLYRRVLLVAPERQSTIYQVQNNQDPLQNANPYGGFTPTADPFTPTALGNSPQAMWSGTYPTSWQGVNDLSARPMKSGNPGRNSRQTIQLNTLGDLTNRENRFAGPRFSDDFWDLTAGAAGQDGIPDDLNDDNVPDLYPSLYPNVFNTGLIYAPNYAAIANNTAINLLSFPYVYPGAYSQPQTLPNAGYASGWIHSPAPSAGNSGATFDSAPGATSGPLYYLQNINHNPLDVGDNLPLPLPTAEHQTWWGFPTWRETLSPYWNDPTVQVNIANSQPAGLAPLPANVVPVVDNANFLPAMLPRWRANAQLYTDGNGSANQFFPFPPQNQFQQQLFQLWSTLSWEDDLIMTNVRSFDVKAYDNSYAGYVDLGWGDDLRLYLPYQNTPGYLYSGNNPPVPIPAPALTSTPAVLVWPPVNPQNNPNLNVGFYSTLGQTFAHEGRMPPLTTDQRVDAQFGAATNYLPPNSPYLPANGGTYSGNIGDNSAAIVRMRRVWDSWSTEYSQAPGSGQQVVKDPVTGATISVFPFGPQVQTPPIYPSYPAPYPTPLRGIQIQIRVVDPTNQHVKSLTIRQDFTDKL
jgi:hypothetical protein